MSDDVEVYVLCFEETRYYFRQPVQPMLSGMDSLVLLNAPGKQSSTQSLSRTYVLSQNAEKLPVRCSVKRTCML